MVLALVRISLPVEDAPLISPGPLLLRVKVPLPANETLPFNRRNVLVPAEFIWIDPALLMLPVTANDTPSGMITESAALLSVSVPMLRLKSSVELAAAVPITTFSPATGTPLSHCVTSLQTPVVPTQLSVVWAAAIFPSVRTMKRAQTLQMNFGNLELASGRAMAGNMKDCPLSILGR